MTDTRAPSRTVDRLRVETLPTRDELGAMAAAEIARAITTLLEAQDRVRIVFAAAPSQTETLAALVDAGVDFSRVDALHMDEYVGIPSGAPQRFGNWLRSAFFDRVALGSVSLIDPEAAPESEAQRYASLLEAQPIDIVLAGIGVTGHLAFNDPPVDFHEAASVKVVALHEASRMQQVEEGLFAAVDDVPTHALTATVSRLLTAGRVFCMVSGALKRDAVRRSLTGAIDPNEPASALRSHPNAVLFLDAEASPYV